MRRSLPFSRALMFAFSIGFLPQCSSDSKKRPEPEGATVSRIDSTMNKGFDRKKKQYDTNFRSEFDQKTFSTNKNVKGQKFKTDSFNGAQPFKGTSEYKAGEYSQSDMKNRAAGQTFSEAGKKPQETNQTFATSDSRYGSQSSKESGQTFAGGDDVFKTRTEREAAKAQKKNVLPKIIKEEDQGGKSVYSEQDVKQMLNRN
jgi:hypothetical protein